MIWFKYSNINDDQNIIEKTIQDLETQINIKYEHITKRKHEQFINTANQFEKNQSRKQLFRHPEKNNHNHTIIEHYDKKILDDDEISKNLEDYHHDLYENRPNVYGETPQYTKDKKQKIIDFTFEWWSTKWEFHIIWTTRCH